MSVLKNLKTSKVQRSDIKSAAQQRRFKLLARLEEQRDAAQALIDGRIYTSTKRVTRTNEAGELERVTVPKRLRTWFWHDVSGTWFMEIKYGSKALRLDKDGATSVVVDKRENLVATINLMIDAVHGSELDAAIEAAAKR